MTDFGQATQKSTQIIDRIMDSDNLQWTQVPGRDLDVARLHAPDAPRGGGLPCPCSSLCLSLSLSLPIPTCRRHLTRRMADAGELALAHRVAAQFAVSPPPPPGGGGGGATDAAQLPTAGAERAGGEGLGLPAGAQVGGEELVGG